MAVTYRSLRRLAGLIVGVPLLVLAAPLLLVVMQLHRHVKEPREDR